MNYGKVWFRKMKRVLATILAGVLVTATLAGCGSSDDAKALNLSSIDAEKYVTSLGEYKGLELSAAKEEITDEYLDSYIAYVMESNPITKEVTGRAVQTGDVVNIDYVGKKDGVAFEGGTADGYDLTIGSGQFIPGFEDGLIGTNVGDVVDLELTFPEDYHSADLAGAAVVFTVTVNSISESYVPELTDEYVASLNMENSDTVEEFKAELRAELEANAETTYQNELQVLVSDKLLEIAEFEGELPEGLMNYYRLQMDANMENYAKSFQMETMDFISMFYGMTEEQYEEQKELNATNSVKQALVCKMIADKEGIEITDEELNQKIKENYALFGFESVEAYMESGNAESYRDSLLAAEILQLLLDNAVITEPAKVEEPVVEETTEAATE